jgi:hypothetical protein
MTKVLAFTLLVLPAVASADDSAPAPVESAAPGSETAPAPASVDQDPCETHWHGHWGHWGNWQSSGRFALGFSKGHVDSRDEGGSEGSEKSFVARLNGRYGWAVELELAKLSLGDDEARTTGLSIVKAFGHRHLQPYLIAGAGGGRLERADGSESHLHFGEAGGGVMLRGRHLAIGFDVRHGVRHVDAEEMSLAARMTSSTEGDDHEHYTHGRVLALVYF